jgi:5'(3')-deoxyribonucleotidase
MNKIRAVVFDFDGVVVSSGDVICKLYNLDPINYEDQNFEEADFSKCVKWDMSDVVPLIDSKTQENMFASSDFFDNVEFNVGMKDLINQLHEEEYQIVFCSRGTVENINKKNKWLKKHFPFAIMLPVIGSWDAVIEKDWINMKDCVFIDDRSNNLSSSNASFKILYDEHNKFGREWNSGVDCADTFAGSAFNIYTEIKKYENGDYDVKEECVAINQK